MRKVLLIFSLLLLGVAVSFGQVWKYVDDGAFPNDTLIKFPINNGVAVDPAGKVWLQTYSGAFDSLEAGVYTGSIYVFNADGTPASFSPIQILSGVDELGNSITDTLDGSGYGMDVDWSNGDILSVKWSTRLWRIDHTTGAGIRRIQNPIPGYTSSLASVSCDGLGEVFVGPVVGPAPIQILNPDFSAGTQVTDAMPAYARDIAVSADGNDVFAPIFTALKTYVYHCDFGSLGPYALTDSIFVGMSTEVVAVSPTTGYVWGDADTRSDSAYTPNAFYAYDPATKAVVDSFNTWPPDLEYPRGLAFSPTGDTLYVAHFGSGYPYVERYVYTLVQGVERVDNELPTGYELAQNFPNPFNPSTEIRFSVGKDGFVTLKVYDLLGREIETLVSEDLHAGVYSAKFDASRLSSGTYVYVLSAGDVRISKKMLLTK